MNRLNSEDVANLNKKDLLEHFRMAQYNSHLIDGELRYRQIFDAHVPFADNEVKVKVKKTKINKKKVK